MTSKHKKNNQTKANEERAVKIPEPVIPTRSPQDRRFDAAGDRAIRMIEAVLTYVEANAIDYDGVWLDEGCEEECEEFLRMYIDEKIDLDPPSFNAKHSSMRISHFPNIVRNYLIKYCNPLIPTAATPAVQIISTSPNNLNTETGQVIIPDDDGAKNKKPDGNKPVGKKKGILKGTRTAPVEEDEPPAKTLASTNNDKGRTATTKDTSSAAVKFAQAQKVASFLSPIETTVFARLLVHIAALHHRACFNGLVWRNMGIAFSFLMRAISPERNACAYYTEKTLEFFITNIDSLFDLKSLELFGSVTGNDKDYGTVKLSQLARETFTRAKYRLFPGSPAATMLAQSRAKTELSNSKMKPEDIAALVRQFTWVDGSVL